MSWKIASAAVLAGLLAAHVAMPAQAYTLVGSGYNQPVFLTAPVGDSRLFVLEKAGVVKVQQGGSVSTWLDLSAQVASDGERGLVGLAFDPGFASNGYFYVNYTDKTTLNTVVARYTANSAGVVDPNSARTVITIEQPAGQNTHKSGWMGFSSADPGQLYIASGDGGGSYDPQNNAQNKEVLLGKILRITPGADGGYTVPANNPFVGVAGRDEIWAYGLRNPFRDSFDRQTGDLWIADVGQSSREEVNFAAVGHAGGANYGWRIREGTIPTPTVDEPSPPGLTDPIYDYGRLLGGSVIGGYVYRGGADASLEGRYVFGDFVSGRIWSLTQTGGSLTAAPTEMSSPFGEFLLSSFGEDGMGGLYVMGLDGNIYQLAGAVPEPGMAALLALGLAAISLRLRRRPA